MAISTVRAAYYRLAKEQHPDRAPEAHKEEASKCFMRLRNDFEEAITLMEQGIRPKGAGGATTGSWQHQQPGARPAYNPPVWEEGHQPFQHRAVQKFDLYTRVKGNLIFWSGLFVFLTGFREFLVWSAGSCYAWSSPSDLNPFWVRRFKDEWTEESAKERVAKKTPEPEKPEVQKERARRDRGVSNFYQKRGISNVRRKTEPRGLGTSL